MGNCCKCNKPYTVGTQILVPSLSAYKDSSSGTKAQEICIACFKKL